MIKCMIVDDEPLAIELLESHLKKIEALQLVGKARNAIEAHKLLQQLPIDLLFLDIQMPHLSGIELMRSLPVKPKVIFTTAFREFAVEGFELEAVDYILKPITFERFFKAVSRILRDTGNKNPENTLMIRSEGLNRKIRIDDIIFIESQGNDLKLFLTNAVYLTKNTIADFAERLATQGFVRIHRSFLFNPDYVTGYSNSEIALGSYSVPVGRFYKQEFNAFVKNYAKTV
ncbi:LytTR family DNA-binding domain-containing protein [Siphonobacter sp. SORGH_AS_0500]|uniref:LytR/AlgR family response regulator transcription factor n=1 Tax=Siphonobacter sp. SORGH_AS_0500 TaxID=1864824 RepID=UPI00285E0A37|nr:LytTR family DNA-binding domain-containing protein [Siphonobacter sp. SORGH_AS_0500]MDR6195827.1 DNA-binding LytR/AlgR family response regulator [Siphonobacter sp. SORGH_AS_0500]